MACATSSRERYRTAFGKVEAGRFEGAANKGMQEHGYREEPNRAGLVVMSLNKDVLVKVFKHMDEKQLGRLMRVYERQTAEGAANEERLLEAGKEFLAAGAA